jgi:hypothetical protein
MHITETHHGDIIIRSYVLPRERIELHSYRKGELISVRSFSVGDAAEYDSFNLSYWGKIKSITEKSITIAESWGSRSRRLKLDTFAWRNWDWTLEGAQERSRNFMD